VTEIVEHKDASDEQRQLTEVNSGVYAFDVVALRAAISQVTNQNSQSELYLTDVVRIMNAAGHSVVAHPINASHIEGANDRQQLAALGAALRDRSTAELMLAGVTIVDPQSVWIDSTVHVEPDVVLLPGVQLQGHTSVATGAQIGPDCTLRDTQVGEGAIVVRTTADGARIGPRASVGPYTYLRPGTVLHEGSKAGGFVEIKGSEIGAGSKVPHLSYVGDAVIGVGSNIGAATVFVNYDGVAKHRTVIGDYVRIGSDTMLVAPVTIGDGAYTAAGSVITEDVPAGAMGVARAKQRNIIDWVLRRRPGTDSAKAALADSSHSSEPREK
jgi:bifunctional UDP-N-acetylglucosamine pyrophosphorylase/glucosamine-1-phosphate N-acetyltransferase